MEQIDAKLTERFMFAEGIIAHVQKGKLLSSAVKQKLVERETAIHLGS